MAVRMLDVITRERGALRYETLDRRVRGSLGGEVVVDSTGALLVWEPGRVVPCYAVPSSDVIGLRVPDDAPAGPVSPDVGRRLLDPRVPFAVHSTPGRSASVEVSGHVAAAFLPADADLYGFALLDFSAFDAWWEEDEPVVAHPRDPYKRVDVAASSRRVRLELDGVVLAESSRTRWLWETALPTRYYLPPEDVRVPLRSTTTRTWCAYKGEASYYSAVVGDTIVDDLAWTYQQPRNDGVPVRDMVAFFHERLDLVVDGRPVPRPTTPWSTR